MNLAKIQATPWVAHVLRAITRFNRRMGNHIAASITYFTVLSMIPVIALAFSILSLLLTHTRPDLLDAVKKAIEQTLAPGGGDLSVSEIIDTSLATTGSGWTLAVTMITALWAGTGWIGNLRRGVRAEWEPDFDMANDNRGFFWSKLEDALTFFGLLITLGLTIATSQFGSLAAEWIAGVTHLESIRGHEVFMILAAIVASTIAGWILFMFLFTALPKGRRNWPAIMRGSLVAGFLFGLLQIVAGYLVKAFSSNRAVQAFGSVIIIMLVFNLMARLILLISAWTATSNQPAVAWEWNDCDQPLVGDPEVWTVPGHWDAAFISRAQKQQEKRLREEAKQRGEKPEPTSSALTRSALHSDVRMVAGESGLASTVRVTIGTAPRPQMNQLRSAAQQIMVAPNVAMRTQANDAIWFAELPRYDIRLHGAARKPTTHEGKARAKKVGGVLGAGAAAASAIMSIFNR